MAEDLHIWSDGANVGKYENATVSVTTEDKDYTEYSIYGNAKYLYWAKTLKNVAINTKAPKVTYPTILAAITAATADDTINVAEGKYIENVIVDKAITLQGAGATKSKIVATAANDTTPLVFAANGATVSGFTITHEYTSAEISAWAFNNNGVRFNTSTTGNNLSNCTVTLNRNGIYLNNTQGNIIQNNNIINNRTGINMTGNIDNTQILNNTIEGNWTVGFVYYGSGTSFSTVKLENNTFEQNWYSEILIKDAAGSTGTLNVSTNIFADGAVTYTTLDDSYTALNEPGYADLKPLFLGAGTAVKPAEELPTLRIYNSGGVIINYGTKDIISVDRSALKTALELAKAQLNTVVVSIDGEDVFTFQKWVTADAKSNYQNAISSAELILNDGTATQKQVNDAKAFLEIEAAAAFTLSKQSGNKLAPTVMYFLEKDPTVVMENNIVVYTYKVICSGEIITAVCDSSLVSAAGLYKVTYTGAKITSVAGNDSQIVGKGLASIPTEGSIAVSNVTYTCNNDTVFFVVKDHAATLASISDIITDTASQDSISIILGTGAEANIAKYVFIVR